MEQLSAIPIREPFIDLILKGFKMWELRTKFTKKIGPVGLIRSKSGTVVALARLAEVIELTEEIVLANATLMGFENIPRDAAKNFVGTYAWVLKDIIKLNNPVPYKHPSGAVTWVTLDIPTTMAVYEEAKRSQVVKFIEFVSGMNA